MDKFSDYPTSLTAPAREAAAVVPSDSVDLPILPRALYVGQAGDVAVVMAGGQGAVFQSVPAGTILPLRVRRVALTGTTAAGLLALW